MYGFTSTVVTELRVTTLECGRRLGFVVRPSQYKMGRYHLFGEFISRRGVIRIIVRLEDRSITRTYP
jgi:hypothetical protein